MSNCCDGDHQDVPPAMFDDDDPEEFKKSPPVLKLKEIISPCLLILVLCAATPSERFTCPPSGVGLKFQFWDRIQAIMPNLCYRMTTGKDPCIHAPWIKIQQRFGIPLRDDHPLYPFPPRFLLQRPICPLLIYDYER